MAEPNQPLRTAAEHAHVLIDPHPHLLDALLVAFDVGAAADAVEVSTQALQLLVKCGKGKHGHVM